MTVPGTAAIRARGLVKRYGATPALDGVDLDLPAGAIGAVLGPNGAGKTTLLSLLAGLDRPDAGMVRIAGLDTSRRDARSLVGYVGHDPLLYPDLTVAENLRFFATLYGASTDVATRLAAVGLRGHADLPVRTLSHGETRRAAIARALVHDPDVLLADEPFSGLDADSAASLATVLDGLAASGRTVLFTTHDIERAQAAADTILVLERGRVRWFGAASTFPGWRQWPDAPPPAPAPAIGPAQPASVRTHTPSFAATVSAMVAKDVRTESRSGQFVPIALAYGLLIAVLVHFALPDDPAAAVAAFPGALWLSLVFGTTLGLARAAALETERGAHLALTASPADPGALFLGKWLGAAAFSAVVAVVLLAATAVFLNVPSLPVGPVLAVTLLGVAGWVAVGTLVSAMVAHGRARDALAPLILLPLAMPLLISAVQATAAVVSGAPFEELLGPLTLVAAFDVIFLVAGFLAYGPVLENLR